MKQYTQEKPIEKKTHKRDIQKDGTIRKRTKEKQINKKYYSLPHKTFVITIQCN